MSDLMDRVEYGYATNNGVKIHYAALGQGPLIVMIHDVAHFVHHDAADLVTRTMRMWLNR